MKLKKESLVVSVETEPGSSGTAISKELAKILGIPCYGKEILEKASQISGISLKLMQRYEERNVRSAYDLTAKDESEITLPPAGVFLMAQIAACRMLAESGSCVLIDHHSNIALGDRKDHIRVFVNSDRESKEKQFAFENNLDPSKAERIYKKEEHRRKKYFRYVNKNWGKAGNYDLTVNSTHGTPHILAEHIAEYIQNLTEDKLIHPTQARKRSA